MSYVGHLNEKYGKIEFSINDDGFIVFLHEGVEIVNPLMSSCGRFHYTLSQVYNEYGLEGSDAAYIAGINLQALTCGS